MAMKTRPLLEIVPASASDLQAEQHDCGSQKSGKDAPTSAVVEVKKKGRVVKKEPPESEAPSMKILGPGVSAAGIVHRKPLLRAAQLHELQLQCLIFKYIAAGLPVPPVLVLPIWKSVADATTSSLGSNRGEMCSQFVSFGQCSPWVVGMMDPEPSRCKRTDGKKWRCGKKVVIDQKYCERHMHRGRKCSRKLVEASQTATATATAGDTAPFNDGSQNLEKSNTKVSSVDPTSPRLENLASDDTNISRKIPTTTSSTSDVKSPCISSGQISTSLTMIAGAGAGKRYTAAANIASAIHKETTIAKAVSSNGSKIDINSHDMGDGNCNCLNSAQSKSILDKTRSDNKNGAPDTGLDFSPKSVLPVQACRDPCFPMSDPKVEPGRCRRTDGRKWRCRRDVLPNQKYCAMHMHRGAKKPLKASQLSVSTTSTPNVSLYTHVHPNVPHGRVDVTNSNPTFSISMQISPKFVINDDASTSSTSSDNTISDPTVV